MASITASSPKLTNNKRNYPLNYTNNNDVKGNDTTQSHKKRSISSTIMNYFKKSPLQNSSITKQNIIPESISALSPSSSASASAFVKQSQINSKDSILLYESEDNSRPPVLPLLPLQRLKLLRQRQKLRLLKDSNDLHILSNNNSLQGEVTDPYVSDTVIYNKSMTPSPIKNNSHTLSIKLKTVRDRNQYKKRQTADNSKKGSTWSAVFDYDVSMETHKEEPLASVPEPTTTTEKSISPAINIDRRKIDTNKIPLTSIQRDLLQNGITKQQEATLKSTEGISLKKPAINLSPSKVDSNDKDGEKDKGTSSTVLMPTVGFDFIKNSDTPSKKSPVAKSQEKPAFSFGSKTTSEKSLPKLSFGLGKPATEVTEAAAKKQLPKLSFGLGKPSTEVTEPTTKKPLSFGFTAPIPQSNINKKEKEQEQEGEEEPRRKKRVQPDISIDLTKGTNKPVFSFGQNVTATEKITPTTSTFSFGTDKDKNDEKSAVTKPSFTFGTTTAAKDTDVAKKPSFSFGVPKSAEQEKKSETKAVPSFTFGSNKETTASTTTEAPKSLFTAATSKENSTAPSFSFGAKPAAPIPAAETVPKPAFSFGAPSTAPVPAPAPAVGAETAKPAVPSFSFSKPPASTQPADTTARKPAVPSFSFGAAKPSSAATPIVSEPKSTPLFGASNPSTVPLTTPSFSFGTKTEVNTSGTPSAPSTSGFSFTRAPAPASGGTNPTNPVMGTSPQPSFGNQPHGSIAPSSSAGFNFNQPPANKTSTTPGFNFGSNNNQSNTGGSVFQSGGMGGNTGFNFGGQNQNQMNNSNPPVQSSFHPSSTANFNFGSAGSDPASVFNSSGPTMQPQQIFGGAPANNSNTMAQNGMGNSAGAPTAYSQRKLARMRQPRR
ncbi:hypothetical protein C6P45_001002 [Maudiozyma exigua]|uniref:Uncharacterized protein n=1 Tax=Maudiozyma exigua TaxID=34358 RepID=A0A9P7BDB9_MAUEX|nr:hypothetical protein C6P45_001002 [Kazachstania exigua]